MERTTYVKQTWTNLTERRIVTKSGPLQYGGQRTFVHNKMTKNYPHHSFDMFASSINWWCSRDRGVIEHSKCFLWLEGKILVRTVDTRTEQAAHLMNPKSSNSPLISISFPELSLAFAMLKVARMDAKVSHSCSDGVSPVPRKSDEYRPLRLQHAFQRKPCIIVRIDLQW